MAAASPLDQPYDRLALLPRTLWLPALVCSAGPAANPHDNPQHNPPADTTAQRLADLQRWRLALADGTLPPPDADFGCPDATAALRDAAGQLGLAATCFGAEMMAAHDTTTSTLTTLFYCLARDPAWQDRLTTWAEDGFYGEDIVVRESSDYQRVVVTAGSAGVRLFLNGHQLDPRQQ